MKRIVLIVIRLLLRVPGWMFTLIRYGKDTEGTKYSIEQKQKTMYDIAVNAAKAGKVTIICTGLENLPEEDGYLLCPNHQGMFDIIQMLSTHKRPFGIVLKKELENIIGIKQAVKGLHYLCMDREDVKQSFKVIMEMTKRMKAGENMCIFPEGTRSRDNEILEFKGGSFKPATKNKAPIVPVAMVNSFKPFDSGSIAPVTTQIHYLKPLYYEDYAGMNTNEIAQEVEKCIRSKIAEALAQES